MARMVTTKWFHEVWSKDPENIEAFFRLMEEGEKPLRFRDACMALKVPYMLMFTFVDTSEPLKARYNAAKKARATLMQDERLDIARNVKTDRVSQVMAAKLTCDVLGDQAAKLDREGWGDMLRVEKSVTHTVDAGLLGRAAELLEKVAPSRLPAVLPEKVVEELPE